MKKKIFTKIVKKAAAGCLTAAIAVSGMMTVPVTADAANDKVVYESTDMSQYWSTDKKDVPVKEGYVFGGWYESADGAAYTALEEADIVSDGVPTENVYAKFVPSNVLSVKSVVEKAAETASDSENKPDKTVLRILSAVDSKEYQSVGFEIYFAEKTTPQKTPEMTKVYSGLKLEAEGETIYPADVFGAPAEYFIALDVDSIQQASFAKNVYARPYWVTMDGTKVMGFARNMRVEDKYSDNRYISVPVNLLTDSASPAEIAGGKVVVTYDASKFTVAKNGEDYRIDNGRLLEEMDYKVEEYNGTGTITFVANGANVNTDVKADGLYANIRFQRLDNTAGTTEADLNLEKTAVQFCDWDENIETVHVW